jgi:hypothetical protein
VAQPAPGTEAFFKVYAQWRRGDNQFDRPDFQYDQGHLKFRRDGRRGFEAMLFSRQDRFWTNTYLIPFVNGRGDAQGIRLDTWGLLGANATFIVADQSNQLDPANAIDSYGSRLFPKDRPYPVGPIAPLDSLLAQRKLRTDDMYVARLRRDFLRGRALRLGLTLNRTEVWAGRDSVSPAGRWNSVIGFDSRYHVPAGPSVVRDADISFEFGQSAPSWTDSDNPQLTIFKRPTAVRLSDRAVVQTEVRSLKFGTQRVGYLNVAPGWWMRGPLYQNTMGGPFPNNDETGFIVQSYYLLPERAVTYSNQLLWYGKRVESHNKVREVYNELYVEFVNGFNGKTSYKQRDEYNQRGPNLVRTTHLSWFNELQVESRLAWLRVQSKLQDIGRAEAKQIFVIEVRLNLTNHVKLYNRFALANDPAFLRKVVFTQLQYHPTANMEMFAQYGPDDLVGGSNPVESSFAGSGDQYDVFKLILKGNF